MYSITPILYEFHILYFCFPQRKSDFALYTEALKFFDHKESMVRIAVRTLTLNVYKGRYKQDAEMHALQYINEYTTL